MSTVLYSFIPLALIAVAIVLTLGLWNMLKEDGANRSQKLMRWRVGLQFAAIIVVMAAIYFARG